MAMMLAVTAFAQAANLVYDAKIVQVTERGFVLKAGTENISVEDDQRTKFWKVKLPVTREAFKTGETVTVKVKTDANPPLVRELSDVATAKWLDHIRKNAVPGTIKKIDLKRIVIDLDDKSEFSYAYSEKTKVEVKNTMSAVSDLKEGMHVYAKSQLMPSLDTRLTLLSDRLAVTDKPAKGGAKVKAEKPVKLAEAGGLLGTVSAIDESLGIFDIDGSMPSVHITYNSQTKFILAGTLVSIKTLKIGDTVEIVYRRDKFGRIVASKVTLKRT